MITPELILYIRAELAKERKREDIHEELVKGGGWREADLNEAFRTVIPMQGFAASSPAIQNSISSAGTQKNSKKLSKRAIEHFVFIIVAVVCVLSWYFYHPQIISFWNSGVDNIKELSASFFGPKAENNLEAVDSTSEGAATPTASIEVRDCGVAHSSDIKNKTTYENNSALTCLGESALYCEDATAMIEDPLFPTTFQIVKNGDSKNTCNFKLSYAHNSTLTDVTGKKLAGQYISCPLSVVKAVDESKSTPSFAAPSIDNAGKYASQIYFYGTLGVFMQHDVNQAKIQSLGCSGEYISSVVAGYKMQSQ